MRATPRISLREEPHGRVFRWDDACREATAPTDEPPATQAGQHVREGVNSLGEEANSEQGYHAVGVLTHTSAGSGMPLPSDAQDTVCDVAPRDACGDS